MLVGYARVSTNEQILDLQKDALEKLGCTKIYSDVVSGAKEERKGLKEALEYVREGDTLHNGGMGTAERVGFLRMGGLHRRHRNPKLINKAAGAHTTFPSAT
jgi:Resolvase, N terminal domain